MPIDPTAPIAQSDASRTAQFQADVRRRLDELDRKIRPQRSAVQASPVWFNGGAIQSATWTGNSEGYLTHPTAGNSFLRIPAPITDELWEVKMKALVGTTIATTLTNVPDVVLRGRMFEGATHVGDREAYSAIQFTSRWRTVINDFQVEMAAGVPKDIYAMWVGSGASASTTISIHRARMYSEFYARRIA